MATLSTERKTFMSIDADRLAQQVKLAYDFVDALHRQALGLIKDVETQLGEAAEALDCLQPGGYRFIANRMSFSLATPQPAVADYYAAFFRHFPEQKIRTTPIDERTPLIAFVIAALRERGMDHPEVRFGVITSATRPAGREDSWPRTVEQILTHVAEMALTGGLPWAGRGAQEQDYRDSYLSFHVTGEGVRLADLPNSETVALKVVEPLLAMYRQASLPGDSA
jgi:hypothetical protein